MNETDEMAHVPEGWMARPRRQNFSPRPIERRMNPWWKLVIFLSAFLLCVGAIAVFGVGAFLVLAITAGIFLWLLPMYIARQRGHRNEAAITIITIFLGWTIVGWVVAMAWAVYEEKK